jgi:hypothetical protein
MPGITWNSTAATTHDNIQLQQGFYYTLFCAISNVSSSVDTSTITISSTFSGSYQAVLYKSPSKTALDGLQALAAQASTDCRMQVR